MRSEEVFAIKCYLREFRDLPDITPEQQIALANAAANLAAGNAIAEAIRSLDENLRTDHPLMGDGNISGAIEAVAGAISDAAPKWDPVVEAIRAGRAMPLNGNDNYGRGFHEGYAFGVAETKAEMRGEFGKRGKPEEKHL